jgi:alkanesulfonate monooxygenase SsuD/methylene tetrahydromethanopterin reductase-like flavin-dependent oxidoreductase (luciferase family)
MRFLLEAEGDPFEAARAARDAGLDGVLFSSWPAPLVVAAAVAPVVDGILIAAEVALGDRHPIEVAEEAAVADLLAAGRLIVVAKPAGDAFGEALDLLRTAWAARPFAFAGPTWRVPARLLQNEHNLEDRVRVTPAPLQPRVELWTAWEWPDDARALGHLAAAPGDGTAALAAAWARAERALGPALIGAPRARRHDFSPRLVDELRAGREAFGQDWAVVRGTAADAARIGADVRPLVQLDRLPAGIEAHWALRYDQPIGSF